MAKNEKDVSSGHVQSIEQLTERFRQLNDLQIRAQADLENAQKNLATLEHDAIGQFGTSDLKDLETKLKKMESENEKLQLDYQTHLDQIEIDLAKVEQQYSDNQEYNEKTRNSENQA